MRMVKGFPKTISRLSVGIARPQNTELAEARYSLGLAYENGRGVPQDENQAIAWFRKAAEQGNKDAKAKLDQIEPLKKASGQR